MYATGASDSHTCLTQQNIQWRLRQLLLKQVFAVTKASCLSETHLWLAPGEIYCAHMEKVSAYIFMQSFHVEHLHENAAHFHAE